MQNTIGLPISSLLGFLNSRGRITIRLHSTCNVGVRLVWYLLGFFQWLNLFDTTFYLGSSYFKLFLHLISAIISPLFTLKHIQIGQVWFSFLTFFLFLFYNLFIITTPILIYVFWHFFFHTHFFLCSPIIATLNLGNFPEFMSTVSKDDEGQNRFIVVEIERWNQCK